MLIPQKIFSLIFSFAIAQASWVAWLLAGFSTGGIAVMLERAVALIRRSQAVRTVRQRARHHRMGESSAALALSSSW